MIVELRERTADTVVTYFRMTRDPEIWRFLPQKAATVEEALADFTKTQQPGATSYGRTVYADGKYVGDIWCYCIQEERPNTMISYCIFDKAQWNKGIASTALGLFLEEIKNKFNLKSVGAFTFCTNEASIKVLRKNGFEEMETFVEDGIASMYLEKAW